MPIWDCIQYQWREFGITRRLYLVKPLRKTGHFHVLSPSLKVIKKMLTLLLAPQGLLLPVASNSMAPNVAAHTTALFAAVDPVRATPLHCNSEPAAHADLPIALRAVP